MRQGIILGALLTVCFGLSAGLGTAGETIVLLTSRSNAADKDVIADFTAETGIAVEIVEGKPEELVERITKGEEPADLFMTVDGGILDQAKGVVEGAADVAIMNSYYIGRMLTSKDSAEVAVGEAIGVFFPDQDGAGTHINICGIGLTKNAKNPEAAVKLVEYLVSVPPQEKLSEGNYEFPVNPKAKKAPLLAGWGDFKAQQIDFAELRKFKSEAKRIFEESTWK